MDITVVINQVLMLFFPIIIGYIILKKGVVDKVFVKNLSAFIYNITLPGSIITALQTDFNKDILVKSAILVVISAFTMVFLFFCGKGVAKLLKTEGNMKNTVIYSLMFSNFSFMGYPVAQAFMGEKGLVLATMFSLPIYVFVQSWGVALMDSDGEHKFKKSYVLNPPLIAATVGLVLFLTGFRFPTAISGTIKSLGSMTTPLAMVLSGLIIASEPLKKAFVNWKIYVIAALRLAILPLAIFYITKTLGLHIDICRVSAIITMMPVAANVVITAAAYGKDSSEPARAVMLTTLLSVITIPLVGLLLF